MIATFVTLNLLLGLLPILTMADGTLASGLVLAIIAIATVTTAFTLNDNDLNRFSRLLGPTAFAAVFIPGISMLLQVLPMPARSLTNPIWMSASSALSKPFAGSVSLDTGATLLALADYCACLAAAFVSAAVTLDKPRAENVLSLLTAIATLIAVELIGFDLGYLRFSDFARLDGTVGVIGFVLSCATLIRNYEQLVVSRSRRSSPRVMTKVTASASAVALLICLSAILISGATVLLFAALFGSGVLVSVWAIRRWRLGLWGQAGIAALAVVVAVGFFATAPAKRGVDPTLALSMQDRSSSIERMLSDAKLGGSGAGSLDALSALYRDADGRDTERPTTAAAIAIEMGQPFLWASVIVSLLAVSTLIRRALLRGRDYVYPGAGAGCIAALLITVFASDGILGLTASLMTGVLCGLAFAQSKSASNRDLNLPEESYSRPNRTSDRAAIEVSQ
jgi:hypothetical protein